MGQVMWRSDYYAIFIPAILRHPLKISIWYARIGKKSADIGLKRRQSRALFALKVFENQIKIEGVNAN